MNTNQVCPNFQIQGSNALKFDASRLASLVANRNTRFHLDLSKSTLVEILEAKETFSQKTNPRYTNSHIRRAIRLLEDAIGYPILPIDVTDEFYVEFNNFLLQNCKPSTIQTYFSTIQGCLNWASKHKAPISETYNCWKVGSYAKPKVALTPSMIAHIYYFDLIKNKNAIKKELTKSNIRGFSFAQLERARDQFVLECQIGQRYSDASRFEQSNFDTTKTIFHITQQKTGNRAVVNLSKYAIDRSIAFEILTRYNYKAPGIGMDIGAANKYLHLLCRTIGGEFDMELIGENKINGSIVQEKYKVWQLVTTHTARRTFITYWANNKEMSITRLQKCTGHKDVRQISRYTIIGDDE